MTQSPTAVSCRAFIGLGSNLGDSQQALATAAAGLAALNGCRIIATSSLYRSAPVAADGPDYLNQVIELATALSPEALLHALQSLERAGGRLRPQRNAPRTIDLDLLVYGDPDDGDCPPALRNTAQLTLPHPRLHQRAFVLEPLVEIAPTLRIPGADRADKLLAALRASPAGSAQRCLRWDGVHSSPSLALRQPPA